MANRLWLWRDGGSLTAALPNDAGRYQCEGPPQILLDLVLGRDVSNETPMELGARTVEVLDAAYRSMRTGLPELIWRD